MRVPTITTTSTSSQGSSLLPMWLLVTLRLPTTATSQGSSLLPTWLLLRLRLPTTTATSQGSRISTMSATSTLAMFSLLLTSC